MEKLMVFKHSTPFRREALIESRRLRICRKLPEDNNMELIYANMYPILQTLDPTVGEFKNPHFMSIFVKETGWHIGTCCLYNLNTDSVEMGIRIFIPHYWNLGLGSEVVNGLFLYARENYPFIKAVMMKTPVINTRAIACYRKCSFVDTGIEKLGGIDMLFMKKDVEGLPDG
jgi:RimJ/RimL family protein N-acetyltransferase